MLKSLRQANVHEVILPPWEVPSSGVMSLLTMLEFAASDYIELAYSIGQVIGDFHKQLSTHVDIKDQFRKWMEETARLNLPVTRAHLNAMLKEFVGPENMKHAAVVPSIEGITINFQFTDADIARACHHIESAYTAMRAELGAILFKAIPKEKSKYCNSQWLTGSAIYSKFPDTAEEFQKAGRCFAYGENTACVFHLMRVVDFYLREVARSLNISYDARNWHGIGTTITEIMEQKYQKKSQSWKQQEPFYAEILTDIQAISRGHRNPVLHEIEKKYDERETEYMLIVVEAFANHVAESL